MGTIGTPPTLDVVAGLVFNLTPVAAIYYDVKISNRAGQLVLPCKVLFVPFLEYYFSVCACTYPNIDYNSPGYGRWWHSPEVAIEASSCI